MGLRPGGLSGSVGPEQITNYTIPGILNFIKHEWTRFERERANWEVERAELQAKIAFLQGERKGHDSLMCDLVRRIKMLEFALKQERIKLYKLQHGTDLVFSDMKPPTENENTANTAMDVSNNSTQKEESRKILRDYLREIGFPDSVLEARMARISAYKSLYLQSQSAEQPHGGITSPKPPLTPAQSTEGASPLRSPQLTGPIANGTDTVVQPSSPKREPSPHHEPPGQPIDEGIEGDEEEEETSENLPMTEESALSNFDFLQNEDEDSDEDEDEIAGEWEQQGTDPHEFLKGIDAKMDGSGESSGVEDLGAESAMDEFSSGVNSESSGVESGGEPSPGSLPEEQEWKISREVQRYNQHKQRKGPSGRVASRPTRNQMKQYKSQTSDENAPITSHSHPQPFPVLGSGGMGMIQHPVRSSMGPEPDRVEVSLLGDLAGLSIIDESVTGLKNPATESVKKWEHKYTMRSHFDAVTSAAFHPFDSILITGSEDCTVKVWNLQKASQTRRSAIVDVEPVQTLRGHRNGVLCVAVGISGELCFSGSTDSTIRVWQLPGDFNDPFDMYDPEVHQGVLRSHSDAVWDLVVQSHTGHLLSCSADGTCRLWDHKSSTPQLQAFTCEKGLGNPTSVDFVGVDRQKMVASYNTAKTVMYDMETAKPVLNFDSGSTYDGTPKTQINKVVCHPSLPVVITGHEDKYIRFYDGNSGKVVHSMTAHMDAVTGLAIDPHGLYLLSGSHDGSLRFWNTGTKICIKEITAHRKRYDESILNVACHLTKPFFASAGADSVAKVFV